VTGGRGGFAHVGDAYAGARVESELGETPDAAHGATPQVRHVGIDERVDEMTMRRWFAGAACAVALVAGSAGPAFAGEVKGPPGTPDNTNETGALDHANSACAASGLNDLDSQEGQTASQVQTAADSWKYYGLPKGAPGTLGLCRGGAGE
jgi:hypothetical protein